MKPSTKADLAHVERRLRAQARTFRPALCHLSFVSEDDRPDSAQFETETEGFMSATIEADLALVELVGWLRATTPDECQGLNILVHKQHGKPAAQAFAMRMGEILAELIIAGANAIDADALYRRFAGDSQKQLDMHRRDASV